MLKEIFSLTHHFEDMEIKRNPIIESLPFGMILAMAGGFLDSYTYVGRGGVFCNAQTGNLVLVGINAAKGAWLGAFSCFLPVIAFVLGVVIVEAIKKHGRKFFRARWPYLALAFEIVVLVGIGLIPDKGVDMLVTIAASFAASIQVSSFNRLGNSGFATTMCTGNLRIAVKTAHVAIAKKDKYALQMSVRYWIIIIAFVIGAGAGGFATGIIGDRAIWIAAGLLASAMGLLLVEK